MLNKLLISIPKALRTWKERGDEIHNLRNMSDYQLSDIGISRSDVERIIKMGRNYKDDSLKRK